MNNKIKNKQITLKSVVDVADYFEEYIKGYIEKGKAEEEKNKDKSFMDKNLEMESVSANIKYTIQFKDGKYITETDYKWFIENIRKTEIIKQITIDLHLSFYTKNPEDKNYENTKNNSINATVYLLENTASIDVETYNQEQEAHKVYSKITEILERNKERLDKTIKNRNIRIQSFCFTIGFILTYILYVALLIYKSRIPDTIIKYLDNAYVIVLGQWFFAMLFGNLFSKWYMDLIYKPLVPDKRYAGYSDSNYKAIYKDDIDEFKNQSEVHFGKYYDAEERRNKIEKIYKITSKIVLIQLGISIILFFAIGK